MLCLAHKIYDTLTSCLKARHKAVRQRASPLTFQMTAFAGVQASAILEPGCYLAGVRCKI